MVTKIENENNNTKLLTAEAPNIGQESLEFKYRTRVPRNQLINTETYPGWLELPLTGMIFYGPKPVLATEVLESDLFYSQVYKGKQHEVH